jgi:hypothetical protein
MSAAEVLELAKSAGISVMIDGDDLVLEAPTLPEPDILAALRNHKAEIVTTLPRAVTSSAAEAREMKIRRQRRWNS